MAKTYAGRWETVKSLSEGGQGYIFVVKDKLATADVLFVLKRLKNVESPERRQRFEKEVEALRRLSHPNILSVVDCQLDGDQPFYVTEYCEPGSLESIGAGRFRGTIAETLKVLLPVADALVAAHKAGVNHRDIKPANILLRENNMPVVGDFGICQIEDGTYVTLSDEHLGSINYVAPEMESGMRHLGQPSDRTDVYSLGKVLYWMLSGGHIFAREDHRARSLVDVLWDQRFEHVHMLLDRMVVRDPNSRLHSQALKEELEMTASLVEGNFAPLKPSIGIRCRFCGLGTYEKYADYSRSTPADPRDFGAMNRANVGSQRLQELGFKYDFADIRVLRCNHCGHVQTFHSRGIKDPGWWSR